MGNSRACCFELHASRLLYLRKRPQLKSTKGFGIYYGTLEGDSNVSQCFGAYYHTGGGLKYSSDFQDDGSLAQIRSSRFGTIRHFSPSEVKLASASALSSFMVRKIKCQTHLSLESHLLPPSTPQPADWASSHPRHVIWCSSQAPNNNNSSGSSSSSNPHMNSKHFTVYLITIQIVPVLV